MSLTISDLILDEEYRTDQTGTADDQDVAESVFTASNAKTLIDAESLNFVSGYTGFPQHALAEDFVSSTNQVTDYFLGDSAGDPLVGVATDLYIGDDQIFLYSVGTGGNIVVGRLGSGTTADPTGAVALAICVDETKDIDGFVTGADLWTCMFGPIVDHEQNLVDSADQLDLTDLVYLGSDFDTTTEVPFENFATVPSGQDEFALIGPTTGSSDVDLIITGFKGTAVGTVNVSTQGLGSNAQQVDEGESLRIDIVDANAANFASADEPNEVHDEANLGYAGGHKDAVAAQFEIQQINPTPVVATVSVHAYYTETDFQGDGFNQDAIDDPGDEVQIDVADVLILDADGDDITAAFLARGGTITAAGDGVRISGLLVHEQVKFTTDGEAFNRFTVTNTDTTNGPDAWDLGAIIVTVLEGGSDTEFGELGSHLIFQDDGPIIELSGGAVPELEVDDSDLGADDGPTDFSGLWDPVDYGADGEGSVEYTLGLRDGDGTNSGLTETSSGHAVFMFVEGGDIVGREGTDATDAETGDEIFRISVDADGNVSLDQSSAVVHDDPDDSNESRSIASDLITLTATAYDSEAADENDSDSATVDIGDSFTFFDDGLDIDEATGETLFVDNSVGGDSDSGDFDEDGGNDPDAHIAIIDAPDSNGFTYSGTDQSITGKLNGNDLYTLTVDDDGGYVFTMIGELEPTFDSLNIQEIKAGGPDTNFIDVGTTNTDDFVRLSGFDANDDPAAINESNANVGVKNGNLDNGESITFQLFAPDGADADTDPDLLTFLGLSIGTKSAKASVYHVTVDFVDPLVADLSYDQPVGKNGTLLIDPDGDDLIQSITIEKVSGPALKLGLADIDILRPPGDFELTFEIQQTDGDDDHDEASFTVQIDGDGDGLITDPVTI